jgi:spore germination protein KC
MRKVSIFLILVILLSCILTGCTSDSKEIDDQVYAIAIGADKGVDNKVRVTIQFPSYKEGGGGGAAGGMQKGGGGGEEAKDGTGEVDGTIVQTVEASSILEAINLFNTFTSRRISLVHIKEAVFSEDFAKSGIQSYLDPLARFREARRIMMIAVCRGSAEEYLKENRSVIGQNLPKAMELMSAESDNTGYFPRVSFQKFYMDALSPYCQAYSVYVGLNDYKHLKPLEVGDAASPLKTQYELLPGEIPRKGNTKREIIGTAVFNGDRMVGSLTSYETRYFLMVKGKFQRGILTIEDKNSPGNVIPFDIRQGRPPKIKVTFDDNVPSIDIKLNIEADIGAIQSRIPYGKIDKIDELNSMLEANIKDGVEKTIEKTQRGWNTDIFGFGYYAAGHFFTIQEFEKYNWIKHYKDARVKVEVEANVRRTGLVVESSPIRYNDKDVITGDK